MTTASRATGSSGLRAATFALRSPGGQVDLAEQLGRDLVASERPTKGSSATAQGRSRAPGPLPYREAQGPSGSPVRERRTGPRRAADASLRKAPAAARSRAYET